MHRLIKELEQENLKKDLPRYKVGDSVRIAVKVIEEGDKIRTQNFEGTVIAKNGSSIRETIVVRRVSFGEGVERSFPVHSPTVQKIEVIRSGKVRRSKLYYLRGSVGKQHRIEEDRKVESPSAASA